jgi:hypothetical protein
MIIYFLYYRIKNVPPREANNELGRRLCSQRSHNLLLKFQLHQLPRQLVHKTRFKEIGILVNLPFLINFIN